MQNLSRVSKRAVALVVKPLGTDELEAAGGLGLGEGGRRG